MLKKCLLLFLGFICFSSIIFSQQKKKQDNLQIISKNPKEAVTINQKTLDSLSTINKTLKEEYDKMKVDLEVCKQLYQQE